MDISRFSNEMLQDLFEEAFEDQIAHLNQVDAYEATIERSVGVDDVTMQVAITGMAGGPCLDDFSNDNVENSEMVTVDSDLGIMEWELSKDDGYIVNATEYVIVYKLK